MTTHQDVTTYAPPLPAVASPPVSPGNGWLLEEQVRLLHDNALLSQFIAVINASILVYVLWSTVAAVKLMAWLGCMVIVSLLRVFQAYAYARAGQRT